MISLLGRVLLQALEQRWIMTKRINNKNIKNLINAFNLTALYYIQIKILKNCEWPNQRYKRQTYQTHDKISHELYAHGFKDKIACDIQFSDCNLSWFCIE